MYTSFLMVHNVQQHCCVFHTLSSWSLPRHFQCHKNVNSLVKIYYIKQHFHLFGIEIGCSFAHIKLQNNFNLWQNHVPQSGHCVDIVSTISIHLKRFCRLFVDIQIGIRAHSNESWFPKKSGHIRARVWLFVVYVPFIVWKYALVQLSIIDIVLYCIVSKTLLLNFIR